MRIEVTDTSTGEKHLEDIDEFCKRTGYRKNTVSCAIRFGNLLAKRYFVELGEDPTFEKVNSDINQNFKNEWDKVTEMFKKNVQWVQEGGRKLSIIGRL